MNGLIVNTPRSKRIIGPGQPVFIVAEMSGNHNQSFEKACAIIDAAAEAGVDAVKLQTYTPETMTIDCDNEYFQVNINEAWKGKTLYNLYKEAYTPWEWQEKLKNYGESKGLLVFSTPFDETAVDFLEKLSIEMYKVASFEIGDLELLKKIAKTGKPVILSRGMASITEIETALRTLKENGTTQVAILHCVSSYPAAIEQMNLKTVPDITKRFEVVSGLSDHSLGLTAALVAVSLGASIIEKHFTLNRKDGGPDAAFSLEPTELKTLVKEIKQIEKALGQPNYEKDEQEEKMSKYKRSLFVVKDIKAGEFLTKDNIRCIRPGYGLPPSDLSRILHKKIIKDIKKGTPLNWEFIDNN